MCQEKKGCQKPEQLKDTPQKCTAEQIENCHGDVEEHPCCREKPEGQ